MGWRIFKKNSKKLKYGLTKKELRREIYHYRSLLNDSNMINDHTTIEQCKSLLSDYEKWLANFDNLDINKDGRLNESELENK
jgi:hypothetical protein